MGAGDLGAGDGRGAGVRMDLQHRSDLALSGLDQTVEQVAVGDNSMPHRIPTMLRNLTVRPFLIPHRPMKTAVRLSVTALTSSFAHGLGAGGRQASSHTAVSRGSTRIDRASHRR